MIAPQHVLLVDDNRDDAELTMSFCITIAPHLGFVLATTGKACWDALTASGHERFDAIVLDYALPDTDGLTLLDEIVSAGYPAPVIIVTGRDDVESAVSSMKAGAMDYMVKSRDYWQHLPRAIDSAIERYHLERENQRLQRELSLRAVELEQAVRQAQREKARLQAVLDQLPEGVLLVEGTDGYTTAANRAAEELWGHSFVSSVPVPHDGYYRMEHLDGTAIETGASSIARVLRTGELVMGEQLVLVQPRGDRIVILMNVAPLLDEYGTVTGAVAVFQDISELKKLEQLKDDILSIASHELKNPLTVIMGYSSLLARSQSLEGDTRAHRAAQNIRQQSQRMFQLIERLLDLSRLDLGRLILQSSEFDLWQLLLTVAEQQQQTTNQHQITLASPLTSLSLYGDQVRLEQVLVNIVSNAVKYSPDGGNIAITLSTHNHLDDLPSDVQHREDVAVGPYAVIQVRDNGIGISEADQKQLFSRFYRTKEAAQVAGGQGLGLYISAEIVRLHGGIFSVQSKLSEGSLFSIVLPQRGPKAMPALVDLQPMSSTVGRH